MSLSHEDYLLLILADGRWHSLAEILRRHPMMAHSRASSLREKGYDIQHRCVGKGAAGSEYRLVDRPLSGSGETARPGAAADRSPGAFPPWETKQQTTRSSPDPLSGHDSGGAGSPESPALPAAHPAAPPCAATALHRAPERFPQEQAARAKRQESMAGQLSLTEEAA